MNHHTYNMKNKLENPKIANDQEIKNYILLLEYNIKILIEFSITNLKLKKKRKKEWS